MGTFGGFNSFQAGNGLNTNSAGVTAVVGVSPVNVNSAGVGLNSTTSVINYTDTSPVLPTNVIAWVPITVQNAQTTAIATSTPFRVVVNSSTFSSYLAANLKNVCFFDSTGAVLTSWLESGESNGSTSTTYWILPSASIAANTTITIYMGMAATTTLMINGTTTGAEPLWTGGTYGQYDNGASVFSFYDNFAGTTLSSKWTATGTPTINNGFTGSGTNYATSVANIITGTTQVLECSGYANTTSSGTGQWFIIGTGSSNIGLTNSTSANNEFVLNYNGSVGSGTTYTSNTTASNIHSIFGSGTGSYSYFNYTAGDSNFTTDYPASTMSSTQPIRIAGGNNIATIFFQYVRVRPQLPNVDTNPTITAGTSINQTAAPVTLATAFTTIASATITPVASGEVLISAYGVLSSLTDATQLQIQNGTTVLKTVAKSDKLIGVVQSLPLNTATTITLYGQSASGTDTYTPQMLILQELF